MAHNFTHAAALSAPGRAARHTIVANRLQSASISRHRHTPSAWRMFSDGHASDRYESLAAAREQAATASDRDDADTDFVGERSVTVPCTRSSARWQLSMMSTVCTTCVTGDLEEAGEDEFLSDEGPEVDVAPEISTAGTSWGDTALQIVRRLLSETPSLSDLELYSLQALPALNRVSIRLDKLTDDYGSPTMEECSSVARAFTEELAQVLGEEAAGAIEVEVSSAVRGPAEL